MHKIFLALILLSIPVSTNALAHSGLARQSGWEDALPRLNCSLKLDRCLT